MTDSVSYIRKHLKEYLKKEIADGRDPKALKRFLINYGFSSKLVNSVFRSLGKIKKGKRSKGSRKSISIYLNELLMTYIRKKIDEGYTKNTIRTSLIRFGIQSDIVDPAIDAAFFRARREKNSNEPDLGVPPGIMFAISIVAMISIVFMISASSDTDPSLVFVSFFPTMIMLTSVYAATTHLKSRRFQILLPLIATMICIFMFIMILGLNTPLDNLSEPQTILVLNAILTLIFSWTIAVLSKPPHIGEKIMKEDLPPLEFEHPKGDRLLQEEMDLETDRLEKFEDSYQKRLEDMLRKS